MLMYDVLETSVVVPSGNGGIHIRRNPSVWLDIHGPKFYARNRRIETSLQYVYHQRELANQFLSEIRAIDFINDIQKKLTERIVGLINNETYSTRINQLKVSQSADSEVVFYFKKESGMFNLIVGDENQDVTFGFVGNEPGKYEVKYLVDDFQSLGAIVNHFMLGE